MMSSLAMWLAMPSERGVRVVGGFSELKLPGGALWLGHTPFYSTIRDGALLPWLDLISKMVWDRASAHKHT